MLFPRVISLYIDIDECFNASICGSNVCSNINGSYTCNCASGYGGSECTGNSLLLLL